MAPPTDEEKAALQQGLVPQLASTSFACMEPLEALTNGTTNFVFRGRLTKPQPDGARSVIIKHSRGYAAVNKDLPLDSTRSAMAAKEFDKKPPLESENDNEDADWGVIHGDFWSGNEGNLRTASSQQLFIVDWEFAQYGHRAYDIGQLIGDLIERDHFRGAASSLVVLSGFVSGYGFPKNNGNSLAFRVAIHAGVQLIGCYIRRAPTGPLPGTPEQVEQAMKLGTDLVVRGWKKDTDWFKNSILAALFD
ncbi:hypothetical protein SEUCBS140593_005329 [Sporothrix eucalyptigena]|uniref:Aminoglycoside phosphotransferase domain-containing protein n=1 Tax=Sporothrix eucalyptigena TaxID=1812306 RepID=A0ABP0BVK2_9PEZI